MRREKKRVIKYNGKLNVIGDKLREYREARGLSLSNLSDKLQLMGIDIPKSSLQNIEVGKRVIREYEFCALCLFYKISMEKMMEDFIKELQ